jgi:predicted nucleic acid-binding protein
MKKLFLDTNIVLDVILGREEFVENALKVLTLIDRERFKGYISSLSCSNIYYITAKHFNKLTALKKLEHFRVRIQIADVGAKVIDLALSSDFEDFEDAVQYYSALETNCDIIITRNKKHYNASLIPVFTPKEFLRYLES